MGLYVEVMCDERKEHLFGSGKTRNRCWSDENNNPQGYSVANARRAAREHKWLIKGNYACCPGCAALSQSPDNGAPRHE